MKRVSLNRYKAEICEAPWSISRVPVKYWKDKHNQLKFFNWLGKKLSLKSLDDWYNVKTADIINNGGRGLLSIYKGSLPAALKTVYTEHDWIYWKFPTVPHSFWNNKSNRVRCVQWIQQELDIHSLDDWYRVQQKQVEGLRGATGLIRACGSLCDVLMDVYPEHNWEPWRFNSINLRHFQNPSQLYRFADYLTKQLHIQQLDDWYRVSLSQIQQLRGASVVESHGGLLPFLSLIYPDHNWNYLKFNNKSKRASQRWLKMKLCELFPNEDIVEEYQLQGNQWTLDLYLPTRKVGFEYQGKQHYQDLPFFKPLSKQAETDRYKRQLCSNMGITLLEVPYWWDNKADSLKAMCASANILGSQAVT